MIRLNEFTEKTVALPVLAATWANLLDKPDELLRQSQLGQLAVAKHFTLNATAKKLSECFASL